ncbi:alcohol dehydrogenase catalytic domain-containing protein [Acidimangrovimonas sediminis]|uniref:alcohol dehydrogenase catalytic domain-containing protein n=1 Tax=Acidimangrovimonas sediminis TaxID=2056283 RepID=UPI0018ECA7EE
MGAAPADRGYSGTRRQGRGCRGGGRRKRPSAYFAEVFSGGRRYPLELPAVPGAGGVGRVVSTGADAVRLHPGDWVYVDTAVRSRDDVLAPKMTLQGLSARGEGGLRLQRRRHDGTLAEQVRVPLENAVPLGDLAPGEALKWAALGPALVPYGGFLKAGPSPAKPFSSVAGRARSAPRRWPSPWQWARPRSSCRAAMAMCWRISSAAMEAASAR